MAGNSRLLVFDLDGTLADTSLDIVHAVNVALKKIHISQLPESVIMSFVGEGAAKLLAKCFAYLQYQNDSDYKKAVSYFLSYYHEHFCDYTLLYPGVKETLPRLSEPKAVLTNKVTDISRLILEKLEVADYFVEILGADVAEDLKPNPHRLVMLMQKYNIQPQATWMIGDSPLDVETARRAHAQAAAVTYGFHKPEVLQNCQPDYVISSFSELLSLEAM